MTTGDLHLDIPDHHAMLEHTLAVQTIIPLPLALEVGVTQGQFLPWTGIDLIRGRLMVQGAAVGVSTIPGDLTQICVLEETMVGVETWLVW